MAEIGQGHNSATYGQELDFDFIEFVRAILLSSASTSAKLISVSIGLKAHDGRGTARPRRSEITHMASCSEATFKRSYEALKVFFEVSASGAANTQYTPKSCITVSEIDAAISTMEVKKRSQNDTTGSKSGDKKRAQNATSLKKEIPPIPPKEKNITTRNWRERESQDFLESELLEACNGAASLAACPGLISMAEPIKWIESGCDLDLDILPTVRARAHKMRPGSVKSWSYFTDAVADAKAAREAPMPEGRAPPGNSKSFSEQRRERQRHVMTLLESE
jgi:hypothetical protein